MSLLRKGRALLRAGAAGLVLSLCSVAAWAEDAPKPNILVIWGDDVGMWNISAYHRLSPRHDGRDDTQH
ncbi:hypothetical protein [Halopseudomonas sp.]|uniref:hypothetical protein n=1 Tax=Halopseudomonas sp. TaxID=2901191 RepID=UPI00311E7735